jgi:RNA polymerase sigma-70 factor (ECF subfamily)
MRGEVRVTGRRGRFGRRYRLDRDTFDELFQLHSRSLVVFFAVRVFDPEEAVDLMTETFERAISASGSFAGSDPAAARAWLYGIAKNVFKEHARLTETRTRAMAKLANRRPLEPAEIERIEELADLADLRARVRGALPELTAEHREVLALRVVEERPYDEIARILGITDGAARTRVFRALSALAQRLHGGVLSE